MKKMIILVLMFLSTFVLALGEVHASGDPGFTVHSFTNSDTTHNVNADINLSTATVILDGSLIQYKGVDQTDGDFIVSKSGTDYFHIEDTTSSDMFRLLTNGSIENTYGAEFVIIIDGNPNSYETYLIFIDEEWVIFDDADAVIDAFVNDNLHSFYINGENWLNRTLQAPFEIINETDTYYLFANGDLDGIYEDISISLAPSSHPFTPNEITIMERGQNLYVLFIIELETNPAAEEKADFYPTIFYSNDDEISLDYDQVTFRLWDHPDYANRVYIVPDSLLLYLGGGIFDLLNTDYITLAEFTNIPSGELDEFSVSRNAVIEFYSSDNDTELTDYFTHLKLVDVGGEGLYSFPLAGLHQITITFEVHFSIFQGSPRGEYIHIDINGTRILVAAQEEIAVYLENIPPDLTPVIDGEAYYSTTYDQPITEATIRANLSVWDDVDGDLTSSIVLVQDNYTPNNSTVGSWTIEYSVTDSSNNTAYLTVTVIVLDNLAPVFSGGQSSYTVSYATTFNVSNMVAAHTATDDHDGVVAITVQSNTYTANKTIPGTYQIVLRAEDSSGNATTKTITIYVVDDVPPVITAPTTITKSTGSQLSLQQILAQVTSMDAIDGNLTSSIQVISNTYAGRSMIVGSWTIQVRSIDNSGNTSNKTITINVVDDIAPVWYVIDGLLLTVDPTIQLSINNIKHVLIVAGKLTEEEAETVTVLSDNYSSNYSTVGSYTVNLGYSKLGVSQTLAVSMKVIPLSEGASTEFTVLFITNGGSYIQPQVVEVGSLVTRPTDPTRQGYIFSGWYEDENLTQPWSFTNSTITADTNLYAKWTLSQQTSGTPEWATTLLSYWWIALIAVLVIVAYKKKWR